MLSCLQSGQTSKSLKSFFYFLLVSGLFPVSAWNSRAASQTQYGIEEQNTVQQTGSSSVVSGYSPLGYSQFSANAKINTVNGTNLSAAPVLSLPSPPGGSVTFPVGTNFSPTRPNGTGFNNYFVSLNGNSLASVNAGNGSGTFTFTLGNATAQPTLFLNTASPTFPPNPMLTNGGTWSGGVLVLDSRLTNILTFNAGSFTTYTNGLGGWINYQLLNASGTAIVPKPQSVYIPTAGFTNPALNSFTIAVGTLVAGQTYIVQADFNQIADVNTNAFTGTGITGNPLGASFYTTSTFITVQTIPLLACVSAGNGVIVSWPSAVTGWTLQTNKNLATGAWGNYLGSVSSNSVTSSPPVGNRFFRLTRP